MLSQNLLGLTLNNVEFPACHVQDMCEPAARQQQLQFQAAQCASLSRLWRSQQLVDVHLQSADGDLHGAHRVVLASSSGFFRALLCGAGQSMKEGSSSSACGLQDSMVVQLPYSSQQIASLLTILYEHNITVSAGGSAQVPAVILLPWCPGIPNACSCHCCKHTWQKATDVRRSHSKQRVLQIRPLTSTAEQWDQPSQCAVSCNQA
jgi:hypothetical protein